MSVYYILYILCYIYVAALHKNTKQAYIYNVINKKTKQSLSASSSSDEIISRMILEEGMEGI
jgi:hypothetical protein